MRQSRQPIAKLTHVASQSPVDQQQPSRILNQCRQQFFHVPSLARTTHHLSRYYFLIAALAVFALIIMVIDDQSFLRVFGMYEKFGLYVWSACRGLAQIVYEVGRLLLRYLLFSEEENDKKE